MRLRALALVALLLLIQSARPQEAKQDAKPVTLTLQFPQGITERMVTTQELKQTLTSELLPAPVNQFQKQIMEATLKVGAGREMELAFERIRSSDNFRGPEIGYDSDKDKLSEEPAARVLNALIGAKLQMKFAADGKLEQFSGMNNILELMGKAFPKQEAMIKQLKEGLGDEAYRDMLGGHLSGFLPGKAVSPGDTWTATQSQKLAGLGSIQLKLTYKLEGVEEREGRKVAKISFAGKGTLEGNFVGAKGAQIKADDLEQTGVIYFDLDRGWLAEQRIDQVMKGNVIANGTDGKEVKIAIEQKTMSEVKITSK